MFTFNIILFILLFIMSSLCQTSLEGIEPEGGTALTDAIINGANQLKGYQCKK